MTDKFSGCTINSDAVKVKARIDRARLILETSITRGVRFHDVYANQRDKLVAAT